MVKKWRKFIPPVTILILIDGFLQYWFGEFDGKFKTVTILILIDGFLQYKTNKHLERCCTGHNPYFNRWFSAIKRLVFIRKKVWKVTILILIDGFLQYDMGNRNIKHKDVTILILIDGFLQ